MSDSASTTAVETLHQRSMMEMSKTLAAPGDMPADELAELRVKFDASLDDMKRLKAMDAMFSPNESSAGSGPALGRYSVPAGLPYFQWEGFVTDKTKPVFKDVLACLDEFVVVLQSVGMDIDNISWAVLKEGMVANYGVPLEQTPFTKIREFLSCRKKDDESMEAFIERFKSSKLRSEVSDKHVVSFVFFDAFDERITDMLLMAMANLTDEQSYYDLDQMNYLRYFLLDDLILVVPYFNK
ncbi:hypothetical protein MBANPS3_001999 [Mucor bainieri]